MSIFSETVSGLAAQGPVVAVTLSVPTAVRTSLQAGNQTVPSIPARALLDTGASISAVQQGLPAQLGLNPVGVQMLHTATHSAVPCLEYSMSLKFPNGESGDFTVVESNSLQNQGLTCLIGRDVLQYGILIYQGKSEEFTLCF